MKAKTKFLLLFLPVFLLGRVGLIYKVVDGDTVKIYSNGQIINCRIANIDSPEKSRNKRAKKFARECIGVTLNTIVQAGHEAKKHAMKLLQAERTYKFSISGTDRYNRKICTIYLPNGSTFNEKMVFDGYATAFERYIPKYLLRKYKLLELKAKINNRGLWKSYRRVMQCIKTKTRK